MDISIYNIQVEKARFARQELLLALIERVGEFVFGFVATTLSRIFVQVLKLNMVTSVIIDNKITNII